MATEQEYLENKPDRTMEDVIRLLQLRVEADSPADDAVLGIVYREPSGMFRRVVVDRILGSELLELVGVLLAWVESPPTKCDRGPRTHDFNMLDLHEVEGVELHIDQTGKVWFNVNDKCLFRAGVARIITINDERPKTGKSRRK